MALKLSIEMDTGVVAEYWRIIRYVTHLRGGGNQQIHSSCVVALHKDKAARNADKEPIQQKNFRFPPNSKDPGDKKETRAEWYAYLKTLPEFAGAIDD